LEEGVEARGVPGGGEACGPQCESDAREGGGAVGPEVGGGDTGHVTESSSPLGAVGDRGIWGTGEETQMGRTGLGPIALLGGLLIIIGGDGG
jgi:hypothetical protein